MCSSFDLSSDQSGVNQLSLSSLRVGCRNNIMVLGLVEQVTVGKLQHMRVANVLCEASY